MGTREREHIDIWLAYSDLFSGLLVVSIGLLLFALIPNEGPGEGGAELQRRKAAQWAVTQKLFDQIRLQGYQAEPKSLEEIRLRFDGKLGNYPNLVRFTNGQGSEAVLILPPEGEEQRITFGESVLFDNDGQYMKQIKPEGIDLLRSVGPIILAQGSHYREIRVFGHTDVKPPKGGYGLDYNWALSAERAIAVVTELLTDPEIGRKLPAKEGYKVYKRGNMELNFPPNRISAIGRGEFEPVGSSFGDDWDRRREMIYGSWDDERKMTQNRRIEIVLRSASPEAVPAP
jgi:flagellar motor protein MotB